MNVETFTSIETGRLLQKLQELDHRCSYSLHFNGHFSGWTWVSQYQNVSIVDFIGEDDGNGGTQLEL